MCGIVAAVGCDPSVVGSVLDGLKTLEYRGYDSAGLATVDSSGIHVRRKKGKIEALRAELKENPLPPAALALAHTRWATHGAPEDRNAHPHRDHEDRVVVVHNGIIENYSELRSHLQSAGHEFSSDTDSEVLAHLIAAEMGGQEKDLHQAVRAILPKVKGAYALVAASKYCLDEVVVARQDSPLIIGVAEGLSCAASDIPALLGLTRTFLPLDNGESASLRSSGVQIFDSEGQLIDPKSFTCDWSPEQAEKGGYSHFMLKEIEEQPHVLARTALGRLRDRHGDVEFEEDFGLHDLDLAGLARLRFMAMGTSSHAAMLGKLFLEEFARLPGDVLNASEFLYSPVLQEEAALTVVLSQSGETADSLRAMREVQRRGGQVLGICNVRGSTLHREADHTILTHCGPEVGVASTKAFFGQLTALYLLAIRVGRARGVLSMESGGELLRDLRALSTHLEDTFSESSRASVRQAAQHLLNASSCLFLGRGFQYPIAMEGALKLKEISYIHAEGYSAGEMKHGPIALIDEGFPVIVLVTAGRTYEKTLSNIEEVRARGGKVIAVANREDEFIHSRVDAVLPVPTVPEHLAPLVNVIPIQYLAFEVALLLGQDIDQPRNLAKSVTVE